MNTNQGRDIGRVSKEVSWRDIDEAAQVMWREVRRHSARASCECPVIEVIARLQELGYVISKNNQAERRDNHEDTRRV